MNNYTVTVKFCSKNRTTGETYEFEEDHRTEYDAKLRASSLGWAIVSVRPFEAPRTNNLVTPDAS